MSTVAPGRRPGMMDVARLAGVSHQTVSRVLNDPGSVRPGTRSKVQAAIEELGYRRNMAARALVTQRTRMIGVVTAGSGYFGPSATTSAIATAARAAGYASLVASLASSTEGEVGEALDFLVNRAVDGVVVVAPQTWIADSVRRAARTVPIVMVADGFEASARVHVVSVDQELGAGMATRHLLSLGHRRILHVAGPSDWFDAVARAAGWRTTLEDAGQDVPEVVAGDWSPRRGYEIGSELVARGLPDAVFASNDLMALGILAAFRDQGVRVPEDVSVVGYDDVDGAAYFAPPLTTVRQPFRELGALCLEVLLGAIEGAEGSRHSIPPSLRVRRTSA